MGGVVISKLRTFDGVTLFFVISGFLITFLLLKERETAKTIKISAFYMRRILRIWPIYYAYIFVAIGVCCAFGLGHTIINNTLWYYLFFAANIPFIGTSGIWIIVHFWSIGVEEQFYLFWPWIAKIAKRYLLPIACTICLIWLGCKYGSRLIWSNQSLIYKFFGVTRFHCMMLGAIGAILYERKQSIFIRRTTNRCVQIIAWILFLLSGVWFPFIPAVARSEITALLALILIMGQVSGGIVVNLENRIFDFVGKISYGIYVIHPLLIFLCSKIYCALGLPIPNTWFLKVIIYVAITLITIGVAWLSYQFYEKPFLHLKSRFAIVKSKNSLT